MKKKQNRPFKRGKSWKKLLTRKTEDDALWFF